MRIDPPQVLAALAAFVACCTRPVAADGSGPAAGYLHIAAVAPGYAGRDTSDDRWFVYLEGYIDTGAAARLARVLDEERIRRAVVYLDSPGGHVVEAMALGRVLRERSFATSVGARAAVGVVPRAGRCYSACPIAFAGGVRRWLEEGSVLGIHRAENSVPVPSEAAFQHVVTGQVKDYLASMGVSEDLVTIMFTVPNNTIRELTMGEAERLGLVNVSDPGPGD